MNIKAFEVRGYFGLYREAKEMSPDVALRELVQNAVEAGARTVEIRLTQSGITIVDDGCGMSAADLKQNFSRFHESGKKIGDQANYGIGAKMAFLALGGVSMTITSRKGNKEPVRIELGRAAAGPEETDGFVHGPVEDADGNIIRPGDLNPRWKTEVFIRYTGFEAEQVLKALNGRFESVRAGITVHYPSGSGRGSRQIRGYISAMERASTRVHRHELRSCVLIWGQRGSSDEHTSVLEDEWGGMPLAFSHRGEIYSTRGGEKAAKWLDGAGIPVGHKQLFVLIQPRGRNLRWNNSRTNVLGVEYEEIQLEIAKAVESGELAELAAFMEWFEAAHTRAQESFQAAILNGLAHLPEIFGILPPPGKSTKPQGEPDETEGDEEESERGDRSPSSRTSSSRQRRKPRGLPTPQLADEEATGGCAVVYSAHRNALFVWPEHPLFKTHLDRAPTRKVREQLKALLCLEIVAGYARVKNNFEDVGQAELDIIAMTCGNFMLASQKGLKARLIDYLGL